MRQCIQLGMALMPELTCFIKSKTIFQNYLQGRSQSDNPQRIDHNIPQPQVIFYPNLNWKAQLIKLWRMAVSKITSNQILCVNQNTKTVSKALGSCDRASWAKCEERENQQDATIRCLLSTSVSTCFGHHYAHLQENKDRVLLHMVCCADSAGCGW